MIDSKLRSQSQCGNDGPDEKRNRLAGAGGEFTNGKRRVEVEGLGYQSGTNSYF
jgi:hypothetical protein